MRFCVSLPHDESTPADRDPIHAAGRPSQTDFAREESQFPLIDLHNMHYRALHRALPGTLSELRPINAFAAPCRTRQASRTAAARIASATTAFWSTSAPCGY